MRLFNSTFYFVQGVHYAYITQFLNLTQYTKLDSIQWTPGNNTHSLPSRTDDHWLETKGIPRQLDRCLPSSEICEYSKTRYKTMCFKQKLMPKCVSRKFFYNSECWTSARTFDWPSRLTLLTSLTLFCISQKKIFILKWMKLDFNVNVCLMLEISFTKSSFFTFDLM